MPTPSLLIVPARWKTGNPGKLYSQIPTNGDGDFNVTGVITGATNAGTRVNNLGYIEPITTSGTPRLDYYTSSGLPGCPALLVEPSGSNLALQSENFGTTWSPNQLIAFGSGSVLNTTGTLDPYGTNVSDLIVANTVSGVQHRIDQTTTSASGSYTFSVFVKAAGYNFTWLRIGTVGAFFNLSNGAITGTSAGIVASSQNYGNGWYRCIISKASSSANEVLRINIIQTDGVTDFAGDGTSGIYVFGAQYETGTVATSYIPTTTAAVTRNADVITVSGAVSGSIGQTEGTIYAEFINTFSSSYNDGVLIRVFSDANNEVFGRKEAASNRYTFRWRANSQNTTFTSVNVPDGVNKVAIAYKSGDTALFLNGVQIGSTSTDVRAFSVNPTTVALGSNGGAGQFFNDRIRAAALYTTRLTNAELMLLTMPGNNTYLPQAVWNNYLSRTGNTEVPDCLYTRHADLLDV